MLVCSQVYSIKTMPHKCLRCNISPGGWGRLLVNHVPMREQRTAKLTLNGVFDILILIPLFTLSSQNVTLSDVVN